MSGKDGQGPNRTVFQPSPLQQRKAGAAPADPGFSSAGFQDTPPQPQEFTASPGFQAPDDVPQAPPGVPARNPMMGAAGPLLALLAAMRSGRARMSLPDLHRRAGEEIEAFRQELRHTYSEEELRRATYALAATADDIALNLPFNEADMAEWAQRSLVVQFFHEAIGGDRFWRLLEEMVARPATYAALLELYHACMGAGFEGRYRVMPGGRGQHEALMQQVFQALPHPSTLSRTELAPQWRGETVAPATVGLWSRIGIVAALAAALLLVVYFGLHIWLGIAGRDARTALASMYDKDPLTLSREAPPPPAPVSSQGDSIRERLKDRIRDGEVEVVDEPDAIRVRTTVPGLFASASDHLLPQYDGLFAEVARALNAEPGDVRVQGYTDSDPPRGATFTDNEQLSKARADAAAAIIRDALTDKSRKVTVEAYGDAQPLKSNKTADGKARNRRVEVVIQRSDR